MQSLPDPATGTRDLPPVESLWTAICETSSSFVVVVNRQRSIQFCNRVTEGQSLNDVLNRNLLDFTTPESAEHVHRVLEEVFTKGGVHSLETSGKRLSGEISYFLIRVGPIMVDGQIEGAMICAEDILLLKESDASLQHERGVLKHLLDIQERERQLVSYEIHDGLSQYVAGAIMHLQAFEHASRKESTNHNLTDALHLLRAAADESRRLITGLRPSALDELGIVAATESLLVDARTDIPRINFSHSLGNNRLPQPVETTIFRIVQESLSNARRHAQAQSVDVSIDLIDEFHVRITIQDDGIGFHPAHVSEERFGLEGIRQRSRLLGGEASIVSEPGAGTLIQVILPLARHSYGAS